MARLTLKTAQPYFELACAAIAGGLWYGQGGAVWYAGSWPGAWPLALLVVGWLTHLAVTGFQSRPKIWDALLWLFLATALLGVWVAYDPALALAKFWLIVGAVGVYYALVHQPDFRRLYFALACLGGFAAGASLYFLATNDWHAHALKMPALIALGERMTAWLPALSAHRINPNVMGGLLAGLLPLYLPLTRLAPRRWLAIMWSVCAALCGLTLLLTVSRGAWLPALSAHRINPNVMGGLLAGLLPLYLPLTRLSPRRWLAILWGVCAALCGLTLLLTVSRGAWLGLWVMGSVYALWRIAGWWLKRRGVPDEQRWPRRWRLTLAGVLAAVAVAGIGLTLAASGHLPGAAELSNRLGLWRDAALLAKDYAFTGAGLGMFEMQFSIYTLLIHVGFIAHSHSWLMDVLIEQGLIGLLSLSAFLGGCLVYGLWRAVAKSADKEAACLIEAGLLSLGVLIIHGLAEDALYGSRGVLLMFVPAGLIIAAGRLNAGTLPLRAAGPAAKRRRWIVAGLAAAILAAIGLAAWRPLLGAWYANRGAVAQSQVELGHYDQAHFDNPTMDQVRQAQNLDEAIAWLTAASALDPAASTARQRLAAIDLARGQYAAALDKLQAAWRAGWRDAVTRKLLGDAYVANGQVQEAVDVVRGLPWAEARLEGQAWSRYWVNHDFRRAADAWAAVVLLNPANQDAAARQAEAERRARGQ